MGTLTHEQIDDFVETTLPRFYRDEWVDISEILQDFTFAALIIRPGNTRPQRGGQYLDWKLEHAQQGSYEHAGLFSKVTPNRVNVMTKGKVSWAKQQCHSLWDLDEPEFQSGEEKLIDYISVLEKGLVKDFYRGIETDMWTAPSSSTLDPMPPAGIPFWVQKNATLGFNGGDPAGWAAGAGNLLTGTYAGWKNYTGTYVLADRDDLVEKAVVACDLCDFKAPVPFNEMGGGPPSWMFCTVHSVFTTLRRALEKQNDNLGREVAWGAGGQIMLRGNPITWVPALTNSSSPAYDSSAPFYGLNMKRFGYCFQEGRNMMKIPPYQPNDQPTVRVRALINWGNFWCSDRRSQFVFYVA